jgi:hypothetical protein
VNQSGTHPIVPTLCRKRSSVKWKNVVWPDPPEVLRKKQEKALRAEREKMAILDRPAYKAPVKRLNTPMDYSVQQSYAVNGGYYGAPTPTGPTGPYQRPAQPYAGPHNPQLQQAYGYQPNYPPPPPQQQHQQQQATASYGGYASSAPSGSEPRFATQSPAQPQPQPPSAYQSSPGPSMSAYYQQRQQEQQQERLAGGGAVPPFLAARTAQMQAHQGPSFSGLQQQSPDAPIPPRQEPRPAGQASTATDLLAAAAAAAAARSASPATEAQA